MNDDLISRQAAIDGINNICPVDTEYDCTLLDRVDVRCVLSDLPSAQPERKKGRWILHETMNDRYDDMICPFCRKSYTVDANRIDDIGFTAEDFNFCPNCGADMRGEEDE